MSTAASKILSDSQQNLICSFINHGKKLGRLLEKWKSTNKSRSPDDDIKKKAAEIIKKISQERRKDQFLPESCPKEVIHEVLKLMENALEKVKDLNSNNKEAVDLLLPEIKEAIKQYSKHDESEKSSPSQEGGSTTLDDDPIPFPWKDHDDRPDEFKYSEAYKTLGDTEKRCLSFCCGLLPHKPSGERDELVEISKRELIHWWTGMDFIKDPSEGERVLKKLVAVEFLVAKSSCPFKSLPMKHSHASRISSSSNNNNIYIMHTSTLSKLNGVSLFMRRTSETEKGLHRPLYMVLQEEEQKRVFDGKSLDANTDEVIVAINRRLFEISAINFNKFFRTENVKILHLGSWPYDPEKYVVVEEIDTLKSMKFGKVTSLSLRGVAGIVDLPDSIYKITTLKVLDLKACPNLENIPKDIALLKDLTHLDLSECYLLDCIPKGITELSKLQVLKGFIINAPQTTTDKQSVVEQCSFDDLSKLKKLIKLAVRAKVMIFPSRDDLNTLSEMQQLKKLKVTWVLKTSQDSPNDGGTTTIGNNDSSVSKSNHGSNKDRSESNQNKDDSNDAPVLLPAALEKLELKAAHDEVTASRLLDLINYGTSANCPKKLYIIGGGLQKFDLFKYRFSKVETLRLRHLLELRMKWPDCGQLFPKLNHLEVLNCPKLFFPCDENGMWDKSQESWSMAC